MSNVTQIRWETVPQNRSGMRERSVCNFNTRGEKRVIREEDRVERCEENERTEKKVEQF